MEKQSNPIKKLNFTREGEFPTRAKTPKVKMRKKCKKWNMKKTSKDSTQRLFMAI